MMLKKIHIYVVGNMKDCLGNILTQIPLKIRFLVVGGSNTAISYLLYFCLISILGEEKYQLALIFAWFFSSFISFVLQKTLVFQTKDRWFAEYFRCLLTWGVAYGINAVLLEVSVSYLNLNPLIAQIIALCFTTALTYIMFKYFAFNQGRRNA